MKGELLTSNNGLFAINVTLNGEEKDLLVKNGETLLAALRRHGSKGTKKGCDSGDCGACVVLVDGVAMLSCMMLAVQAHDRHITTIEGLGTPNKPHSLQKAYVDAGAVQCGFCIPGMILASQSLLNKNAEPTEEEIRYALDGNLCRCTGYVAPVEAVMAVTAGAKPEKKRK